MKKTIFILTGVLLSFVFYSFNKMKVGYLNHNESKTSSIRVSENLSENEIFDPTGIVALNAKLEMLGEGYSFTEGPAVDKQGNVYLTNQPGVTGFNKNGERIFNVPNGENWTANVVFGGENRDMLFITAMGRVYGLKIKVKGAVK